MSSEFGIKIEGPNSHEQDVAEILKQIASSPVGRVIVVGIATTGKELTIVPFDAGKAALHSECNAVTKPNSPKDSAPERVRGEQKGAPWYRGDEKSPDRQVPWKLGPATGRGSDVKIWFSPDVSKKSACSGRGPGSLADESLIHELTHALRAMQGRLNPYPTEGDLRDYHNEEEFLAITTTNVYMSGKGTKILRGSHNGWSKLRAPLDTSEGFLAHSGINRLMNIYRLAWKPTYQQLTAVRIAKFNPFQQLEADLRYLS